MIALVAPSIAALAIGWVALLTAAPHLPIPLAGFLYVFGSVICHQISERSFHMDGAQLPVCARCLGIYAGFAAGALAAVIGGSKKQDSPYVRIRDVRRPGPAKRTRRNVLLAALPTLVTVALEWTGLWYPSNMTRAIAGLPLGIAVALVVIRAVETRPALHYETCLPPRPAGSGRPAPPI